jgi:hypothetical protein
MNKGRGFKLPGIGLAGDWPGGWTQTYAQVDTEAGDHGFDEIHFVRQVAGLSQLAGEFMLVTPLVIDLGWGQLKSALAKLPDSSFAAPYEASAYRQTLLNQYIAAFGQIQAADLKEARGSLKSLVANISAWVASDRQDGVRALVEDQLAKLA